jgi:hypothetical protein
MPDSCEHQWANTSGRPLRCRYCGVAWPGDPTFPPAAYKPPWYPDKRPEHNPWTIAEPISGLTHYDVWVGGLPKGELLRLIEAHRDGTAA